MASVLRVTWERREVRKRVTPTYPMSQQHDQDLALPGRTPGRPAGHPAAALDAAPALGDTEDATGTRAAPASGGRTPRGWRGRQAGQHRRAAEDAQGPGDPAGAGRPKNRRDSSGSPASSSTGAIALNRLVRDVADPRLRPRRPRREAAATANSDTRPSRRGSSASRASIQAPPARQASRASPGGTWCASAQTAADPVPPPGGQQPRRSARDRGRHPGQLAHGITPHRTASGRCRDAVPRGQLYIDRGQAST